MRKATEPRDLTVLVACLAALATLTLAAEYSGPKPKIRKVKVANCDPALLQLLSKGQLHGRPFENTLGVLAQGDDGCTIVRGYLKEGNLCLEDLCKGRVLKTYPLPKGPNGEVLFTGAAGYNEVTNTTGKNPVLSPTGRYAALGSSADKLLVLDLTTGETVGFDEDRCDTAPCGFSADGLTAFVENQEGKTWVARAGLKLFLPGRLVQIGANKEQYYVITPPSAFASPGPQVGLLLVKGKADQVEPLSQVGWCGALAAALSPDEKSIAVISSAPASTLRLFDLAAKKWKWVANTGRLAPKLPVVLFSPRGSEIIVLDEDSLAIFAAESGFLLSEDSVPETVELIGFFQEGNQTEVALVNQEEIWLYHLSQLVAVSRGHATKLTEQQELVWSLVNPVGKTEKESIPIALQLARLPKDELTSLEGASWLLRSGAVTAELLPSVFELIDGTVPPRTRAALENLVRRFPRSPTAQDQDACGTERGLRRVLLQLREEEKPKFLLSLMESKQAAVRENAARALNEVMTGAGLDGVPSVQKDVLLGYLKSDSVPLRTCGLKMFLRACGLPAKDHKRPLGAPQACEAMKAIAAGLADTDPGIRSESARYFPEVAKAASKDCFAVAECVRNATQCVKIEVQRLQPGKETPEIRSALTNLRQTLAGLAELGALNDKDHRDAVDALAAIIADPKTWAADREEAIAALGECRGKVVGSQDALLAAFLKEVKAYQTDARHRDAVVVALNALGQLENGADAVAEDVLKALDSLQGKEADFLAVFPSFPTSWGKSYPELTAKLLLGNLEKFPESGLRMSTKQAYIDRLRDMLPDIRPALLDYKESKVKAVREIVAAVLGE